VSIHQSNHSTGRLSPGDTSKLNLIENVILPGYWVSGKKNVFHFNLLPFLCI
jgi:hypothetical protein